MNMEQPQREPSLLEAVNEIAMIRQNIRVHPLDTEPHALEEIRVLLETGKLTPREAIAKARAVADSMQDYK